MKSRALWYALVAVSLSMTTGCHCFRCCFPNLGWRLHDDHGVFQGHHGASGCAPACGPVCAPAYRPPVIVPAPVGYGPVGPVGMAPDCPGCVGGVYPVSVGPTPVAYPPVIGNPMPLPGATVVPNELHNPAPVKPNGN